nr:epidermal growth factor-like protein 7 isoform X5 [Equus caballus]
MGHSLALAPLLSQATPAVCPRNARPFVRWKGQAPAQWRHRWPPLPRRAAATRVQGMTEPPSLAAGCVPSGFPGAPCPSPSCNACTSPFSPPAMGTEPAAHTGHPVCLLPTCICEGSPILSAPLHFWGARPHHCWLTIYRTAYRRSPGPAPARPRYACCPGWKRTSGLPGACGAAVCQPPCQNGGVCVQPGRCHCPAGWRGDTCQTDVDECSAGRGGCPQRCVNTAGSYWCQCWEGHSPSADGAICLPKRGTARVPHPHPTTGVDSEVKEEVQRLRSRVDVLEQKLQLVLAPLHSLASRALEHGLPDPGSLLAHSFQQLDRIDSLSEQISFLEEQLGSCSCKKEL